MNGRELWMGKIGAAFVDHAVDFELIETFAFAEFADFGIVLGEELFAANRAFLEGTHGSPK